MLMPFKIAQCSVFNIFFISLFQNWDNLKQCSFTEESEKTIVVEMDQEIKIESVESNCLAEPNKEITIKEELYENNIDNVIYRNFEDISKPKPRFLENSIKTNNVHGDSVEGKNIDIIKNEVKTESNEDYEIDLKSEILAVSCDPKLESQEGTICDSVEDPLEFTKFVHEGKKPVFLCDQCDKQFSYRGHLNRHISSVHDGKKSDCDQCNKQFSDKCSLKRHISAVHEGKALKVVDKRKNKEFNVHQKVNRKKSKRNPLKIDPNGNKSDFDSCKSEFNIKNSKDPSNVSSKDEKPFQCQNCDRNYKLKKSLKTHIETVHNGKKFDCDQCNKQFTNTGYLIAKIDK